MLRLGRAIKGCLASSSRFISSKTGGEDRLRLDGRVAIVTAGTDGIGLAIAKRLARNGAHVVVSSRTQSNVDKAVDEMKDLGLKVTGIACHVGKDEERKELLKKTMSDLGAINILVQNAGVNPHIYGIMDTPASVIDKTCQVHIKANFQIVQEIAPYMTQSKHQGSIILTSSVMAYLSNLYPGIYAITKAAVLSMTKAFMNDLMRSNIRINCLTIGTINTKFMEQAEKNTELKKHVISLTAMQRFGNPDECAGIAAFLASDDASYVTGENLSVTGGLSTRL